MNKLKSVHMLNALSVYEYWQVKFWRMARDNANYANFSSTKIFLCMVDIVSHPSILKVGGFCWQDDDNNHVMSCGTYFVKLTVSSQK